MMQNIGYKIRKVREIKGLSQEYISSKLGITQKSYSKIESGDTNIDEEKLERIAKVLGIEKEVIKNFNEQFIFNSCAQFAAGYINSNHINPLEKVQELYEKLLAEKEARISALEALLEKR